MRLLLLAVALCLTSLSARAQDDPGKAEFDRFYHAQLAALGRDFLAKPCLSADDERAEEVRLDGLDKLAATLPERDVAAARKRAQLARALWTGWGVVRRGARGDRAAFARHVAVVARGLKADAQKAQELYLKADADGSLLACRAAELASVSAPAPAAQPVVVGHQADPLSETSAEAAARAAADSAASEAATPSAPPASAPPTASPAAQAPSPAVTAPQPAPTATAEAVDAAAADSGFWTRLRGMASRVSRGVRGWIYDSWVGQKLVAAVPWARGRVNAPHPHCFEVVARVLDREGLIAYNDNATWDAITRGHDELAAYFAGLALRPDLQKKLGLRRADPPPRYDQLRRGTILVWGPGREQRQDAALCPDPFDSTAGHIAFVSSDLSAHPTWENQETRPITPAEWRPNLAATWAFQDESGRTRARLPCLTVFVPVQRAR